MDEMVLRAQRFVNSYSVAGIPTVDEDGITGWQVMYALTRALQHELGITALSNSFGPTTLSRLSTSFPMIDGRNTQGNINRIVQAGLYCKGYDGGEIDGVYNPRVAASVVRLKQDAGVGGAMPGDGVSPKLFKAILTLDAYVLVGGGTTQIQGVQRWLNAGYLGRRDFYIVPCDGVFSRDVQRALVYAIQFNLGMSDDVATGALGQLTRDGLRQQTVRSGSTGVWVNLFTAAMIFNRRSDAVFSSTFTSALATAVRAFQSFVKLPITGNGDYQTWMSLLVSTGDPERRGTACDCSTEVTAARAATLLSEGYRIVGRYLTNVPGSTFDKRIKPGELATMTANGLRFFPIYQTYGNSATYFNVGQGRTDAFAAIGAARSYGFQPGTRIYFAVDYDAFDAHVTSSIIPHFRGINEIMAEYGAEYRVGVYAPRNVCSRVAGANLSSASFVCGMSTGFSGNLGFPLPNDWAFDQIAEYTRGSGSGAIGIDNNIGASCRSRGSLLMIVLGGWGSSRRG